MWVTGTAWLHDAAGDGAPRALALTTSVVGVASLTGPAVMGWLGDRYSLATPFVLLGGLTAMVLVVLLLLPSPEGRAAESSPPLGEMLRSARADPLMIASLVLSIAVALMWMSADLLIPLRLDQQGFSASKIGLAFSLTSVVFLVASAAVSARAERYATVRVATIWTAAFVAALLIAAIGAGAVPTIAFLLAAGLTTGVLISLTYPLGAAGAANGGFSVAIVGALITLVWAGSGVLGPTLGGVAAEEIDDRLWFLGLAAAGLGAALWMWSASRKREAGTRASN
jgi:predicted MFS family arabinose efflux permease